MSHVQHIQAWTDGASSGNPGPAGWAVLINGELDYGWLACATNNVMELFAIYQAIDACPPNACLTIYTDSRFCMNLLCTNMATRSQTLAILAGVALETAKLKRITIQLTKTKGHADDVNNQRVDRAAVAMTKIARNALTAQSTYTD